MYEVARLIDYDSMPEGNELKLLVPNVNLREPRQRLSGRELD